MTEYQANPTSAFVYGVTKDDNLIGTLTYKSWFTFSALLELTNSARYQLEPKGFWGTTIELRDQNKVLLTFKMNWKGEIVILPQSGDADKGYIFKHRGIFKDAYILTDQDGMELLVLKPHLKWSKMNYEYLITSSEPFDSIPHKEMLLLVSLHCANYYMWTMNG